MLVRLSADNSLCDRNIASKYGASRCGQDVCLLSCYEIWFAWILGVCVPSEAMAFSWWQETELEFPDLRPPYAARRHLFCRLHIYLVTLVS